MCCGAHTFPSPERAVVGRSIDLSACIWGGCVSVQEMRVYGNRCVCVCVCVGVHVYAMWVCGSERSWV